jgi:hypothetical protein
MTKSSTPGAPTPKLNEHSLSDVRKTATLIDNLTGIRFELPLIDGTWAKGD